MHQLSHPTRYLQAILLVLILAVAACLRFYNLNWDDGTFAHPDERSTVAFYAPTIRWPEDLSTLLDPRRSTLNPFWDVEHQTRRSYTYGHFPLYVLVLTAHLLHQLASFTPSLPFDLPPEWTTFLANSLTTRGFALIGRALVALSDVFTVYLVFLLGRRLYGVWAGLLAAALSALTVLQIQLAHFFAVDPVSTTFTLLALYGAILMYDRRSVGAAIITGVGIGLAVASKFSALPIAFAPILAIYLAARRHQDPDSAAASPQSPTSNPPPLSTNSLSSTSYFFLPLLALLIAFLVFAVTSPFVLLDFGNFYQAVIEEQGNMVSGVADFPFTRQYRNTWPYIYFIEQQVRWGMWWPLGLLALAGLGWVIVKAVLGKAQAGEWLILGWIVLYFGPTGLFLAKFMRYMIPVVPLWTLFGAGLVGQIANSKYLKGTMWQMANRQIMRGIAGVIAAVVLLGSAFWALAFVNGVYGTEHTWVTFSRWVYANVPDGSCIAWEHWDDRLPVDLPEPDANPGAHHYYQPQLPMYDDDTQQKYDLLRNTLMNCDYIVLASNRLWRTIPKLPQRYPMSTRYYQALFSKDSELGFKEVYSVETPPRLGPITIDDQSADESFTVYDHPKPILFKKVRQLSPAEWDALLGGTWQGAIPGYVGEPTLLTRLRSLIQNIPLPPSPPPPAAPGEGQKSLLLDTPVDQLPVVDDFHWNTLANNSTLAAILIWWLVVMVIGLAALPITFALFHKLPDRGYALSKSLGLLLVGYFVWLNSSLGGLSNTRTTALLAFVVLVAFSAWIAYRQADLLRQFWREQRRVILITEIVFLLVFLFFVRLRVLNPDLWQPWQGGEKMLEIGFLYAIVKSAHMPPYDPFFAGGIMNYYYYGMFLVGILIKLTGIQPTISFNLAVPMLAGLTAVNVFSLAGNVGQGLGQRARDGEQRPENAFRLSTLTYTVTGLCGVLFVVFIGNLQGAAQLLSELGSLSTSGFHSAIPGLQTLVLAVDGFGHLLGGATMAAYNYWDPTRVIPETINEFPYFSFLFADLHPHMIGLPFTALFLSLVYQWLRPANQRVNESASQQISELSLDDRVQPDATPSNAPISTLRFTSYDINWPLSFTPALRAGASVLHPSSLIRWLAVPFILGAIAVINTWDLPTYLGLITLAFLLSNYYRLDSSLTLPRAVLLLGRGLVFAGVSLGAAYLLYAPFFANYQAIDVGLGLVHTKTPLDLHLKIWGFFLFVLVSWLVVSLLHPGSRHSLLRAISLIGRRWQVGPHLYEIYRKLVWQPSETYQWGWWSLLSVVLVALGLYWLGFPVPAYLLPLVVLALLLLSRTDVTAETAYLNLLTFTGLLVLLGVEFFFLRDWLGGGDYYRMNTLFKFYIQVWLLFGVAAAVVLPPLWRWSQGWPWLGRLIWQGALLLLLLAVLVYPLLGTRTRVNDRFPGDDNRPPIGTLDGLAYMTVGRFEWPAGHPIELKYDYQAIRWLQDHVTGTPIIAEAKVGYYREGGMRVAAYTGLPSVLGGLHQNEQRYASQVGSRDALVNEFWMTTNPTRALQLLDELHITYVYVGQIERITYGDQVANKFEQLVAQGALRVVFENPKTKIYERVK